MTSVDALACLHGHFADSNIEQQPNLSCPLPLDSFASECRRHLLWAHAFGEVRPRDRGSGLHCETRPMDRIMRLTRRIKREEQTVPVADKMSCWFCSLEAALFDIEPVPFKMV